LLEEILPTTLPARARAYREIDVGSRSVRRTLIIDHELLVILGFCAIGLLVTINLVLRFPDFSATVAQLGSFAM
jgi:hypothetical protein